MAGRHGLGFSDERGRNPIDPTRNSSQIQLLLAQLPPLRLFFNSTVFISQAFTHREETQVRFPKLREEDLVLLDILDVRKLSSKDRSMMLNTFDRIRGVEFPSLTQQLETRHEARLALDSSLLEILGFADDEVAKTL